MSRLGATDGVFLFTVADKKCPPDSDLTITAVTFIPQCSMIAVGLKNGVFQLWDVCALKRLYRSSISGTQTRVVNFGFQEPCNDPQSFCYLWVIYESQTEQDECLPFAIMYACLFKKISTDPDYGVHYRVGYLKFVLHSSLSINRESCFLLQSFLHCKKRFDLDVDLERSVNGRSIACSVVSNTPSNILRHVTSIGESYSLCSCWRRLR